MARPLPDDVARTARAYLASLLPPSDFSDAWHELVADVDYWGDRDLVPVVRLAHQVVLQHQRLAPEVAVLALAEVGVDDPGAMAAVLDADTDQVARWVDEVATQRDGATPMVTIAEPGLEPVPDAPHDPPAPDEPAGDDVPPSWDAAPPPTEADHRAEPDHRPEPDLRAEADLDTPSAQPAEAVRIGFDDDEPLPDLDGRARGVGRRDLLVATATLAVLILIVWLLTR